MRWRLRKVWVFTLLLTCLCATRETFAQGRDYDTQSDEWNGLHRLVVLAQSLDLEIRPSNTLRWDEIQQGDGLLIIYPRANVNRSDLYEFLAEGGRLALFDDFGEGGPLFDWFQVRRTERVEGRLLSPEQPGIYLASRRSDHPLAEGIETLVTNEPTALFHAKLPPVFAFSDDPRQGVVLAGVVEPGRLIMGGDPSVFINAMLRFAGNEQFARNLLVYLAGRSGGRVHLVYGGFTSRGNYRGRVRNRTFPKEIVRAINEALEKVSLLGREPVVVWFWSVLLAVVAAAGLALKVWGNKPTDRFGPTGPTGIAAGIADKIAVFATPTANMLYPTLIAKRYFEGSLRTKAGLKPPTDITVLTAKLRNKLSAEQLTEMQAILSELDLISMPVYGSSIDEQKVSIRRFLSLWKRIGAILLALGE